MSFDPVVTNPGRLSILTTLASEAAPQEFVLLRRRTRLTDGNLASHAKRLRAAGMIEVDKRLEDGKPVTRFLLTDTGRDALRRHVSDLVSAVTPPSAPLVAIERPSSIERPVRVSARVPIAVEDDADDWVD